MDLSDADYAIFTSDGNKDLNALGLGRDNADQARVLFTTQQMIQSRCKRHGNSFQQADEFFYQGRPRDVKCWDESILAGQSVILSCNDLLILAGNFGNLGQQALQDLILTMRQDVMKLEDGQSYKIPDFVHSLGLELVDVLAMVVDDAKTEMLRLNMEALWFFSGKTVTVKHDGYEQGSIKQTLLDYEDTLPEDIGCILVTDASARVRGTYPEWEGNRGGLIRMKKAAKSYRNLKIHLWNKGSGKTQIRREPQTYYEAVAATIKDAAGNADPSKTATGQKPELWLVVVHKQFKEDMAKGVGTLLNGDAIKDESGSIKAVKWERADNKSEVRFIHWGEHLATNKHQHIKNIILIGPYFYTPSQYEGLGRCASGLHASDGPYPADSLKRIKLGEHAHHVLQAACRGIVRKCDGDSCPPCDIYLVTSDKNGIKDMLGDIFPDCLVVPWKPIQKPLSKKQQAALDYLAQRLDKTPESEHCVANFKEVMAAIGMADSANFKKRIRRHPVFLSQVETMGLAEGLKNKPGHAAHPNAFVKAAASFGFTSIMAD